jgi:hypothetical protein
MDMVESMIRDPKAFRSIVGKVKDVKTEEQAIRLVHSWLVASGVQANIVSNQEEQRPQDLIRLQ